MEEESFIEAFDDYTIKDALTNVLNFCCGPYDCYSQCALKLNFTFDDEAIFQSAGKQYLRDWFKSGGQIRDLDPIALDGDWRKMLELAGRKSNRIRLAYVAMCGGFQASLNVLDKMNDPGLRAEWVKIVEEYKYQVKRT